MTTERLARALAGWIDRRRWHILASSLVLAIGCGVLAARLPLKDDFAYLLPQDAPSVIAIHQLEQRVRNLGTLMIAVESDDPKLRAKASESLRDKLDALGNGLIVAVRFDDGAARQFVWQNRFLYADLKDLTEARDTLAEKIRKAKLGSNPLYVDFEDADAAAASAPADDGSTERLEAKLKDAEARKDATAGFVSKDGKMQLIVVRTSFEAGSASKAGDVVAQIQRAIDATKAEAGPGVVIGMTGDVISGLAEHDALLKGMLKAALLTSLVVALGMLLYYRSVRGVSALLWSLVVGTAATFAYTKLAIGYLNVASAFLSSIVVGNGINFGIILLSRHFEEHRHGKTGVDALAGAIGGTLTGTLAAALTAMVAYGSLVATNFKGFKHFGLIGGVGMLLCWVAAYTVLPAALAVLERRGYRTHKEPALGAILSRITPHGTLGVSAVATVALLATGVAGVMTYRYLQNPYEDNFRNLRSSSPEIEQTRDLLDRIDNAFGRGISGGFVVAAPTRAAAHEAILKLKAVDAGKDDKHIMLGGVKSIEDVLPADQDQKLAVLADLRRMIDHEAKNLGAKDRDTLERLRPPDRIRPIGDADLPDDMAWPFTEKDGSRGKIILCDASLNYDTWLARDLLEFTARVEGLDLGKGVILGGANFVFADVIRSMEGDGPKSTFIALGGALLIVAVLVGLGRHGAITLLCMASGTLLMLAGAFLAGLRVNFLDFVALPITIGIGIDYSVNIVARARQDGPGSARGVIATTGGAVALCSFTTIVGYGSLLLSANQGIRSFGLAAILGELTCITAALLLAPTLLQLLVKPRRSAQDVVPIGSARQEPEIERTAARTKQVATR